MSKSITVKTRQSVFDIALRYLGSVETAFALASANGLSVTDELSAGSSLTLIDVQNAAVVSAFSLYTLNPATAITDLPEEQARIFDETFDLTFE